MDTQRNIFGSVRMGYLVIGSRKLAEWKRFATDAMGLHLADESSSGLALRMDDHAKRLIIENDAAEDVLAVGWQLDDEDVLAVILGRLKEHGVSVECIDDARASSRGVESLHRFIGPKGLAIELFTRPLLDNSALSMRCSGFITGAGGMGHISVMSRDRERSIRFWQDLFDARISDTIELARGNKTVLDVTFMRVNERHHSVAIAATRGLSIDMFRTRIQHFNIEAATVDDLSSAYERCVQMGYKLTRGIGRHPNDKELSFYVKTPSGLEMEMGWDALTVNEAHWQSGLSYPNMSTWGHDIPGRFSTELGVGQLVAAARSLGRPEYFPY